MWKYLAIALFSFIWWGCPTTTVNSLSVEPVVFAEKPKNIVLLIGDGMGLTQVSALTYEQKNHSNFERFPVIGFQKTHAANNLITDSAASATAMATGVKTYRTAIGVGPDTLPRRSIFEEAKARKMATGLVATVAIVHATPAAFVAHQPYRNLYEQIADDFLNSDVDLFIGGGKKYFDKRFSDDRNLVSELKKKGYVVGDYSRDQLSARLMNPDHPFAYFTANNHPVSAIQERVYLPRAAKLSAWFLEQRSDVGFLLMVEGSQIDWAGHSNDGRQLIEELRDFDKAVGAILEFAIENKETLVLVTGDHETGGLAINPGSKMNKLKLAFTDNDHTATMVPVFAFGPGAEHFAGIYDNTDIYFKMREVLGWTETSEAPGQ
ncbi:MAG: alkaline phosphatase [Bacteroidetes bacterium]|nr:MAG: alkaline phosphatase [Bacteroidota bacterium]